MARLWSSGFELNSAASNMEWDGNQGNVSVSGVINRSGGYAGRMVDGVGPGTRFEKRITAANENGPFYVRMYLYIADAGGTDANIIMTMGNDWGEGSAFIKLNSDNTLELWDADSQIGEDSAALDSETWYRIEVEFYYNTVTAKLELDARIDGVSFASTVDGDLAAHGGFQYLRLGEMLGNGAGDYADLYFDDIAVNDTNGSYQLTWPGAGKIVHLRPDAAGDNAATAGLFSDIDEITPNDATDYIELDDDGNIGDYNLMSSGDAGIGADDTIRLASVGMRMRGEGNQGCSCKMRIKGQAAGIVAEGANITQTSTTWYTQGEDTNPRIYTLTKYVNPQDGAAWTPADLDTAQAGVEAIDANPDIWVTTIWVLVEYVTEVVPPTPPFAPRPGSVRLRGPLFSLTARGWLGGYTYHHRYVCRNPYPIGLLPTIFRGYRMPAFSLRPYPQFISQYYSTAGWVYQRRRTWHGITWIAYAGLPMKFTATYDQVKYRDKFADAVAGWQALTGLQKGVWNSYTSPRRTSGYNKYIRAYMLDKPC